MKNKIIYLVIFIFSASLIFSAKKINGRCNKISACTELIRPASDESIKTETNNNAGPDIPSLGLFFFHI